MLSISRNVFPDCWKVALVIPLYRKDDPKLPGNYRPISLLPVLSKVFENILAHQIRTYIEVHNLLSCRQFGFRENCSTDQLVFQLINKLKLKLSSKPTKYATVAALDIKKAFDCVNHSKLLHKCNNLFSFNANSTLLLKNYLMNRSQAVKYNNIVSDFANILTGVPQGSVLGPLLFLIFVNDIMLLENCFLFADDCLVINYGPDVHSSSLLMEYDLNNNYSKWYNENLLVINATKTEIMTISLAKNQSIPAPNINFLNSQIKQSTCLKYLGFYLDNRLTMKRHLSSIKSKLYPVIKNFMRCRKYLSSRIAAMYYKCLIRPILEYCGPILTTASKFILKGISAIENRCLKIISPINKTTTRLIYNIPLITVRFKYLYLLAFNKLTSKLVPSIDEEIIPNYSHTNTRLGVSGGFILGREAIRAANTTLNFGASLYNDLPQQIRSLTFHRSFKSKLKFYLLSLGPQL